MTSLFQNWIDPRNYAHFAHINVQGGHFFMLNAQSEPIYDTFTGDIDSIAEYAPDAIATIPGQGIAYPDMNDRKNVTDYLD